jgi:hypothetical protein
MTMGVQLNIEQSLARNVGVSELHSFIKARAGMISDGAALEHQFNAANFDDFNLNAGEADNTLNIQAELGFMKRVFFGRVFTDFGAAGALSIYGLDSKPYTGSACPAGSTCSLTAGIIGLGATGQVGLGFQASNRLQLKVVGGYRYVMTAPSVSLSDDTNGESVSGYDPGGDPVDAAGAEAGPIVSLDFTWLI